MAYIGEIGKRMKIVATYKKRFDYTDYKFNYYGTTHYTHIFEDADGNTLVWKTTNMVEYIEEDEFRFVTEGSKVELSGSVKEHSTYKGVEQTVFTRCKFELVERAKTKYEIEHEKAEAQKATLGENDFVWEMPYKQYKEHYADCETISGSYNNHDGRSVATIKVIIREGRLKSSGVRGKHFSGYEFTTSEGTKVCYRAVSEENARKQMLKDFPDSTDWECTTVYRYR